MMPRSPRLLVPLIMALLTVAAATPIAAAARGTDPANRVEGKFRLQFDTDFVAWTRGRPFSDGSAIPSDATIDNIGLGFARPLASDKTLDGMDNLTFLPVGVSVFGLGVGYGVHRHVIVGARIGASFDRTSRPGFPHFKHSDNYFSAVFTPYLEIVPRTTGRALPFILLRTGLSGAALGSRSKGVGFDSLDRTSFLGPTVGIGGGAHFLLTDYFSLDASLMFDQRWYFSRERYVDTVTGEKNIPSQWDKTWQSFSLGLALGLSVWF